jgi:hypothetical protein
MGRPEEILEIAELLDETADRLVAIFIRSGADRLHPPAMLREIARYGLDLAVVDIAGLTFGSASEDRR